MSAISNALTRAYLIEPQLLFVPYLVQLLTRADLEVIGASAIVDHRELSERLPALIVVDIDYARRRELSLIREIRVAAPFASIVAYSDRDDELFAASCRVAGATTILSKNDDEHVLCERIRRTIAQA